MADHKLILILNSGVERWNDFKTNMPDDWIADLSGATISQVEPSGLEDLTGAGLETTGLTHGLSFTGGIDLEGIDLSYANLSGATLVFANLDHANLAGTNFENAILTATSFVDADLSGANLSSARLEGAILTSSILMDVNFTNAQLNDVQLDCSRISGSNFSEADLTRAIFRNADIALTIFHHTIVNSANFSEAKIQGCNGLVFDDCNLMRAEFSNDRSDPWHVLSNAYTGTKMALTFVVLVIFFSPYVVKSLFWAGVNQYHDYATKTGAGDLSPLSSCLSETLCLAAGPGGRPSVMPACLRAASASFVRCDTNSRSICAASPRTVAMIVLVMSGVSAKIISCLT